MIDQAELSSDTASLKCITIVSIYPKNTSSENTNSLYFSGDSAWAFYGDWELDLKDYDQGIIVGILCTG